MCLLDMTLSFLIDIFFYYYFLVLGLPSSSPPPPPPRPSPLDQPLLHRVDIKGHYETMGYVHYV